VPANTNPKNNNGPHPWTWFTDKVLPPLIVALCLAVSGGIWSIYRKIDEFGQSMNIQQQEILTLKSEMAYVKANMITRDEQNGTIKRIELYLDNMMLRAGLKSEFQGVK